MQWIYGNKLSILVKSIYFVLKHHLNILYTTIIPLVETTKTKLCHKRCRPPCRGWIYDDEKEEDCISD